MSEQWRGLHNPERHFSAFGTGTPVCDECDDALCVPSNPCYCCLDPQRSVALRRFPQNRQLPGYNDGWNACRMATLRALDGDGDE